VDCNKDGNVVGNETLVSKSNGAVWGNIIAGGGIGYIVDRNAGAGFNYPDHISVALRKIGDAVGVTTPTIAPATPVAANEPPATKAGAIPDPSPIQTSSK